MIFNNIISILYYYITNIIIIKIIIIIIMIIIIIIIMIIIRRGLIECKMCVKAEENSLGWHVKHHIEPLLLLK